MNYPYDPDLHEYVTQLLYKAIPQLYKLEDEKAKAKPIPEPAQLEAMVKILAAPLAVVRQSIEELYADQFIDSANDWVLPYLAAMVGTELVFPDADSNRRDVRGTVSWRRRKGTPAMLQELGDDLTDQMVVTQEGWLRVQMAQDLNLLSQERIVPLIREPEIAEYVNGPLGRLHRSVDIRAISRTTGKYHPKHVTHWVHPTIMFPVEGGLPADLRNPATDPDQRYAFNPLGIDLPLRARRFGSDDPLQTDRVPDMIFATQPGDWFGRAGRFDVKIAGLTAAVAKSSDNIRPFNHRIASNEIIDGTVTMDVRDYDSRRFTGEVIVDVVAVPFPVAVADVPDTTPAVIDLRASLSLDNTTTVTPTPGSSAALAAGSIPMIRLRLPGGATDRYFPGATVVIESDVTAAQLGAVDPELAKAGFLRGALFVKVPQTRVQGERWFYLAANGSLFEAQSSESGAVDVAVADSGPPIQFSETQRRSIGPGPAWPATQATRDHQLWTSLPAAVNAGPIIMHGGQVVVNNAGTLQPVAPGSVCALVFALTYFGDGRQYEPMLRLMWNGPDLASVAWFAIDDAGDPIDVHTRFGQLAQIVAEGRTDLGLAIRFECSVADAVMCPAETAFTAYDGKSVLIHTTDLACETVNPDAMWPTDTAVYNGISRSQAVGRDGSTWRTGTTINHRQSMGQVAPLRDGISLQRRSVHGRRLCQWHNETPPLVMHAETLPRHLDIDPVYGLFAMHIDDVVQAYPVGPAGVPVPESLTVDYLEGYSDHVGVRTEPREPALDERLPRPTRIVSASGRYASNIQMAIDHGPPSPAPPPVYRSLTEAFNAINANPHEHEVIELVDSATYRNEQLTWPIGPRTLSIQGAERERPVVQVNTWDAAAADYEQLTLTGVAMVFDTASSYNVPPSHSIALRYCSILQDDVSWVFSLVEADGPEQLIVDHSLLAGVNVTSAGQVHVINSIIEAAGPAIDANQTDLQIERSTVIGTVAVETLEASECIFMDDVSANNRFEGCIRYSRVTEASIPHLPRQHRLAIGIRVEFVSRDRHDAAHRRLTETCHPAVLTGAEDGGEMGVFHDARLAERYAAYRNRLYEYTPAGLISGMVRMD